MYRTDKRRTCSLALDQETPKDGVDRTSLHETFKPMLCMLPYFHNAVHHVCIMGCSEQTAREKQDSPCMYSARYQVDCHILGDGQWRCMQVWNEEDPVEEVLAMVVRTGLRTTVGTLLCQVTNPIHLTGRRSDSFLKVRLPKYGLCLM